MYSEHLYTIAILATNKSIQAVIIEIMHPWIHVGDASVRRRTFEQSSLEEILKKVCLI